MQISKNFGQKFVNILNHNLIYQFKHLFWVLKCTVFALLSTHNIFFGLGIKKMIFNYVLLSKFKACKMQAKIQNDFAHTQKTTFWLKMHSLTWRLVLIGTDYLGYLLFVKVLRLAYFHPIITTIGGN